MLVEPSRVRKILFILGVLWGENGITSHIQTLAKSLIAQGHQVAIACDLATASEAAQAQALKAIQRFQDCGLIYYPAPFQLVGTGWQKLGQSWQAVRAIDRIMADFQPDIIHLHSLSLCPQVQIARLRHRIPLVSTCHMEPTPSPLKTQMIGGMNQVYDRWFGDALIAVSSELKAAFQALKVPAARIRLIYHGIDNHYFRPPTPPERLAARQALGLEQSDPVICLIGRLAAVKGHAIAVAALAHLKQQGLPVTALFAGKGYGDEEAQIRNCAIALGVIDQIRFLGMTDTRQVLWASDALVFPSQDKTEAFGLVVAEAMLCGVVPIRTPSAGAVDQIDHGSNGFIMPFEDAIALADYLNQIFADPVLRRSLAIAAQSTAQQRFGLQQMVDSTLATYAALNPV
jgi:glycosyltransferase involved in cell wall biosynthesis